MFEFDLNSKAELDQKVSFAPLEGEDYIVKIASIDLLKAPTYDNRIPNFNKHTWEFRLVLMPVALRAGGQMQTTDRKEIQPFSKYVFKNLNPFSTGFQKTGAPSICRSFIASIEGIEVNEKLKTPNFVLIDPKNNLVQDEETRAKFVAELKSEPGAKREMLEKGYTAFPDLSGYVGKYISCTIIVQDEKGKLRNKVTDFKKLPQSFVLPTPEVEKEPMERFKKYHQERLQPRDKENEGRFGKPTSISPQIDDPLTKDDLIEDLPF